MCARLWLWLSGGTWLVGPRPLLRPTIQRILRYQASRRKALQLRILRQNPVDQDVHFVRLLHSGQGRQELELGCMTGRSPPAIGDETQETKSGGAADGKGTQYRDKGKC